MRCWRINTPKFPPPQYSMIIKIQLISHCRSTYWTICLKLGGILLVSVYILVLTTLEQRNFRYDSILISDREFSRNALDGYCCSQSSRIAPSHSFIDNGERAITKSKYFESGKSTDDYFDKTSNPEIHLGIVASVLCGADDVIEFHQIRVSRNKNSGKRIVSRKVREKFRFWLIFMNFHIFPI